MTEQSQTRFQCGNDTFGCGKSTDRGAFNLHVHACHTCCNQAAHSWGVRTSDLTFVISAVMAASAGKAGAKPAPDEVWPLLTKMGIQRQFYGPEVKAAPVESQLPLHDRQAEEW